MGNTRSVQVFIGKKGRENVVYSDYMLADASIDKEPLEASIPDHKWHTLDIVDPFTKADRNLIEEKLIGKNAEGKMERQGNRYQGVFISVAVRSWSLDAPCTEAGFNALPEWLSDSVYLIVNDLCMSGGIGTADFLNSLKPKPEES